MRVAQIRESELTLYDGQRVRVVPHTPYFFLKYHYFEGKKITYVPSKKPFMRIFETGEKEFNCNYEKMTISVSEKNDVSELCDIVLNHYKDGDTTPFENFFARHFAEQNQTEILDVILKPHSHRLTDEPSFDYTIDGIFGIRAGGQIYVKNPLNREEFPWDRINVDVKEMQGNRLILSSDKVWAQSEATKSLILDAHTQKFVTKISYLLSSEKKNDSMFMVQLPRKVQRWIDEEDFAAPINWNVPTEPQEEEEMRVPASYNYFPTPQRVVEILLEHADIQKDMTVLEPSAGQGHILDYLKNCFVTCGELYFGNQDVLKKKGYKVAFDDFMKFSAPNSFDRVVMNPPFDHDLDVDHVNHAYEMLKSGGRLVSVMANGITFRKTNKAKKLRELIEQKGYFVELPDESFKESGTKIRTIIGVLNKD